MIEKYKDRVYEDRLYQRMRSLGGALAKINRILSNDQTINVTMTTTIKSGVKAPGFSKYPNVSINYDQFKNPSSKTTLAAILGMNYHELCHLLYTPRNFVPTPLLGWSPNFRLMWAMNALEDMRIESLFTTKYHNAGRYFTEDVIEFLVNDEKQWETAFLLTYGRSYLPLKIRNGLEEKFVTPEKIVEAKKIIDDYKSLSSQDFINRPLVTKLLLDYWSIWESILNGGEPPPMGEETCGGLGQADGQTASDEDSLKEEEKEKREREEETGEDQSGYEDEESDETGEPDGEEDDDNDGDDDGEVGEEEGDEPADGAGGSGQGEVDEEDEVDEDEKFRDLLDEIHTNTFEDEGINNEINQFRDAMNDLSNIDVIDFGKVSSTMLPPTAEMSLALTNTMGEFRRIFADVEPGWKYGSDSGKLNIDRAISDPENYDEHFDEWDEGREQDAGLEVFIAMDSSGSMTRSLGGRSAASENNLELASKATWVIKRALDDVDVNCTVVSFDEYTKGLYKRDEKTPSGEWPSWTDYGGDTRPAQSFHLARSVLSRSDAPNKLFVIITDGQWSPTNEESLTAPGEYADFKELIESIPGTRVFIGINSMSNYFEENFHINAGINDTSQISNVIAEAVTSIISQYQNER